MTSISRWIIISFSLVGLVVGFIAGLSLTPVVGSLLPPLFGVIGGGAGFFATFKPEYSRSIGISISALALCCLLGVLDGIHLREGIPWHCFLFGCVKEEISSEFNIPTSITDQEKLLDLESIKTVLIAIDMATEDKKRLFELALGDANKNDKSTKAEDFGASSLSDLQENLQQLAEAQARLRNPRSGDEERNRPALKH